jgi:alpha-1,6-mannosyltransferase
MRVHRPLGATPQSGGFEFATHGFQTRSTTPRSRLGLVALAGLLATGLVIALSAAGTDTLLPESVRLAVPSSLAGPFGATGLSLGIVGVVVVLSVMFASYVVAVRAADALSPRAVLMSIAGLHAVVLLAPPLVSTDMFSYIAYARMGALYSISPYVHGPHAIALDLVFPYVGAKWWDTPTAYGPVFTALSYLLAPLSLAASVFTYKAVAATASLATVAIVWHVARLRGVDQVKAVALVGLNPLLVVYGVGGGHNDLLMLAVMVAGMYFVLARRERTSGALMVAAAGIKLTAGLLLPFAAAEESARGELGRRRELVVGAGLAAVALGAASLALFGTGLGQMLTTLKHSQNDGNWQSIPGFVSSRLGLGSIGPTTGLILGAVFLAVFCWLVWKVWRGQLDWIAGAAWATVAMLATASSLLPWYVAWLLPLVAVAGSQRLVKTSLFMTGLVLGIQMIGYVPHASSLLGL